jgi:hypothetical protein
METPGGLRVPTDQEGQGPEMAVPRSYQPARASLQAGLKTRQVMNRK